MAYSELVRDHFDHPRHSGVLADANRTGRATNPICGDTLALYMRVEADRVVDATFQVQGCPAAIAAGSMTTMLLIGRTVQEALRISNQTVSDALGGLPSDKLHCSVLAEDAIAAALSREDLPT